MSRSSKHFILSALAALAGALGAGMAQAHGGDHPTWPVNAGVPVGVPIHEQRAPVYGPPARAYPGPMHQGYRQPTRWDRDGDGIPNRHDRLFNPAWDRDGDGIPNRHDRHHDLRHDRDRDGIPDWRDHRQGGWR